MKTAFCMIRRLPGYRRDAFVEGLKACGLEVVDQPRRSGIWGPDDLLVIWNRYGRWNALANECEAAGGLVLVAENGYLGREWQGGHWYALAAHHHNGAGAWFPEGPGRWDSWGIHVDPVRHPRVVGQVVLLPQRGIGPPGVAMPKTWAADALFAVEVNHPARIREHPGEKPSTPLHEDLATASAVLTWGSGAALKAITWGIPCYHQMRHWIGAPASCFVHPSGGVVQSGEVAVHTWRLPMFQRLAWAMWTVEELATGWPFQRLIDGVAAGGLAAEPHLDLDAAPIGWPA